MKIKQIVITILSLILSSPCLSNQIREKDFHQINHHVQTEEGFPAKNPAIWDFEIKNKSPFEIFVTLKNNGKENEYTIAGYSSWLKKVEEKDFGYRRISGLNLNLPTQITIKYGLGSEKTYDIPGNGKTIYVTWELNQKESKRHIPNLSYYILRPQSGKGIVNKTTQSGLSLKNNLSSRDIK